MSSLIHLYVCVSVCYMQPLIFRLILIAEKETVYNTFPTPLINRLEKHFVLTETILLDWQKEVLVQLNDWINQFSCMIEGSER